MPYWMYASETASLRRTWVPLLAWGVGFMALGIVIIGLPELLGAALLLLLGVSSVVAGLAWIAWVLALRHDSGGVWMAAIVPGALLVAFGAYALINRTAVAGFFTLVAGVALAAWGLADMISSLRLQKYFPGWWVRAVRGLIVCTTGVLIALQKPAGLRAFSIALGLVPIVVGTITVWMALWVRRLPSAGSAVVTSAPAVGTGDADADEGAAARDPEALPPAP
jgi:uncharacterized membrane protein HdeD (DUF308 family)